MASPAAIHKPQRFLATATILLLICGIGVWTVWSVARLLTAAPTTVLAGVYGSAKDRYDFISWWWLRDDVAVLRRLHYRKVGWEYLTMRQPQGQGEFDVQRIAAPEWLQLGSYRAFPVVAPEGQSVAWVVPVRGDPPLRVAVSSVDEPSAATQKNYHAYTRQSPIWSTDGTRLTVFPEPASGAEGVFVWNRTDLNSPAQTLHHPVLNCDPMTGNLPRPWVLGVTDPGEAIAVNTAAHRTARQRGAYNINPGSMGLSFEPWHTTPDVPTIHFLRFTPVPSGTTPAPAQRFSVTLHEPATSMVYFTLSPDRRRIAYLALETLPTSLWTTLQTQARRVLPKLIPLPARTQVRLYVSDADGSNLRPILVLPHGTSTPAPLRPPVWLPNSREVSFIAGQNLVKVAVDRR